jgi:hypothetical protein
MYNPHYVEILAAPDRPGQPESSGAGHSEAKA